MKVLDDQLETLLNYSISQHGYWLKNHREAIEDDLKSGIVRFGLRGMQQRLDDYRGKDCLYLYKKIEASK